MHIEKIKQLVLKSVNTIAILDRADLVAVKLRSKSYYIIKNRGGEINIIVSNEDFLLEYLSNSQTPIVLTEEALESVKRYF